MVIAAEEVDVVSTFWVLMLWRGMVLAVNGEIYGFNLLGVSSGISPIGCTERCE